MFHHESGNRFISGQKVKGQGHEAHKHCRRGSLRSSECWLLVGLLRRCVIFVTVFVIVNGLTPTPLLRTAGGDSGRQSGVGWRRQRSDVTTGARRRASDGPTITVNRVSSGLITSRHQSDASLASRRRGTLVRSMCNTASSSALFMR